ncbi:MAG: DNA polymerase ligase N-terminal domain-containing protein [Planctomycetota bacterium]|nr:DNA polymerase ligase N-terminal domain-containing protein [Planctomycetota bacterium]
MSKERRSGSLGEYRRKRDFRRTSEPKGEPGRQSREPRFVIQQHDATSLHYDFRIEVGGVLKSWAVPKGLSTDPREKRLAIATEDHPLEYAEFEGVIPEGEYGAGPVLIWDAGTYENAAASDEDGEQPSIDESLKKGHVVVRLHGKKLKGAFALQRIAKDDPGRWIIVKVKDDGADARRKPVRTQPESVVSGRTIDEIREQESNEEGGES